LFAISSIFFRYFSGSSVIIVLHLLIHLI
jgi:hypothetical protein